MIHTAPVKVAESPWTEAAARLTAPMTVAESPWTDVAARQYWDSPIGAKPPVQTPPVQNLGTPQLVPGRACGSCMMCCKVPYIEEFDKAPGQWCTHAIPGKGCGIYESRPGSCRAFYCSWMLDANFGPEWKPDRAKFVVYLQRNGAHLQVAVDPSFPGAWTKPPYYARIRQWAREGAEVGRFVFVRIGQRMIAVLPDREVDIGTVGLKDEIMVSRKPGPAGLVYDVVVQKGAAPAPDAA